MLRCVGGGSCGGNCGGSVLSEFISTGCCWLRVNALCCVGWVEISKYLKIRGGLGMRVCISQHSVNLCGREQHEERKEKCDGYGYGYRYWYNYSITNIHYNKEREREREREKEGKREREKERKRERKRTRNNQQQPATAKTTSTYSIQSKIQIQWKTTTMNTSTGPPALLRPAPQLSLLRCRQSLPLPQPPMRHQHTPP